MRLQFCCLDGDYSLLCWSCVNRNEGNLWFFDWFWSYMVKSDLIWNERDLLLLQPISNFCPWSTDVLPSTCMELNDELFGLSQIYWACNFNIIVDAHQVTRHLIESSFLLCIHRIEWIRLFIHLRHTESVDFFSRAVPPKNLILCQSTGLKMSLKDFELPDIAWDCLWFAVKACDREGESQPIWTSKSIAATEERFPLWARNNWFKAILELRFCSQAKKGDY